MSNAGKSLNVVLNKSELQYTCGEDLSGTVQVNVDGDCNCESLTVKYLWETEGVGDRDLSDLEEQTLFSGSWYANRSYNYDFSFSLPPGPPTYNGKLIDLHHLVQVRAKLSNREDLDVHKVIDVIPEKGREVPESYESLASGVHYEWDAQEISNFPAWIRNILTGVLLLLLGVGESGLLYGLLNVSDQPSVVGVLIFFMVLLLVLSSTFLYFLWRNVITEMMLGHLDVEISDPEPAPGSETSITCEIEPSSDTEINQAEVVLKCREEASFAVGSPSDQDAKSYEHVMHESKKALIDEPRKLSNGQRVEKRVTMSIPEDAHPPFILDYNELTWECYVHVNISGWPEIMKDVPIRIQP